MFLTFCEAEEECIFQGPGKTKKNQNPPNKKKTQPGTVSVQNVFLYSVTSLKHTYPLSWSYLKNYDVFLILRKIDLNICFFLFQIFEEEHSVLYLDQGGVLVAMKHTSLPIRHLW